MKSIVIFLFLALFLFRCNGNPHHDPEIVKYITEKRGYVKFTETNSLPKNILIYYPSMITFMKKVGMDIDGYFVDVLNITENDSTVDIPIYHYDGFARLREQELEWEQQEKEESTNNDPDGGYTLKKHIKGNVSGKDGYFTIDKQKSMKVTFGFWR